MGTLNFTEAISTAKFKRIEYDSNTCYGVEICMFLHYHKYEKNFLLPGHVRIAIT